MSSAGSSSRSPAAEGEEPRAEREGAGPAGHVTPLPHVTPGARPARALNPCTVNPAACPEALRRGLA